MRAIATLVLLVPTLARAYPVGQQFEADATSSDGGGGISFTGAPRWAGHTCAVCHTDAPGLIGLALEASPVELFSSGYVPSETYKMRVVMTSEWAARDFAPARDNCGALVVSPGEPYVRCDDNGFAMEIDDDAGRPLGTFMPVAEDGSCGSSGHDSDAIPFKDGKVIVHSGLHHGLTAWTFCWTAPASAGPLTAYLAAVDGNGGDGLTDPATGLPLNQNDTGGDDVFAGAVPLVEMGGEPAPPQSGGCQVGRLGGSAGAALLVGLLLVLGLARRRLSLLVVLALGLALSGCVHVHPWQREQLAKNKMKFSPDPNEDELDLHMQEAREGSQGGYGSAGGGCGCN